MLKYKMRIFFLKKLSLGRNLLAVQWLGPHAFTVEGPASILGPGIKILQAVWWHGQRKKERKKENDPLVMRK